MTDKGTAKGWTEERERNFRELVRRANTFAEQHLILSVGNVLKYDGRSQEGKRALEQARLRMATATDEDIEEIAKIVVTGENDLSRSELIKHLKETRDKIRRSGINRRAIAQED